MEQDTNRTDAKEAREIAKETIKETRRELRLPVSLLIVGLCCLLVAACAHHDKENTKTNSNTVSMEAKQIAAETEAAAVTEITFVKGQSALTPSAQTKLRELLTKSGARAHTVEENNKTVRKIDSVKVISWADSEYPSVHTEKLPKEQRKLAEKRNDTIASFLKKEGRNISVETFNMAERPNILEEFFATDDASIKKSLETLGIPNTNTSVKYPSKASKAIVMVVLRR